MDTHQLSKNTVILATAADLVRCLVMEVAGNEISDSVDGVKLTNDLINEVALTTFQQNIEKIK